MVQKDTENFFVIFVDFFLEFEKKMAQGHEF